MGGGLWGFAMAAEQPLESLLLRVLGRARLEVPHAERNVPARRHDDLVFVVSVVGFRVIQAHVPHDAVDKARREGRGFGAVDDPLVVAGKPYRDVGRGGAHFHLKLGAAVAATDFEFHGVRLVADEHAHAMFDGLVSRAIVRENQ